MIFLIISKGISTFDNEQFKSGMRMQRLLYLFLLVSASVYADTIDRYMNIANNIPQMEMKADQESQLWSKSARTVLILTSESIAETLILSNQTATQLGSPLFCLPIGVQLSAETLNDLIQQTYRNISSQQSDKDKMTVSQVALLGLRKQYPCQQQAATNKPTAQVNAWSGQQVSQQAGQQSSSLNRSITMQEEMAKLGE